jgi:hypothetical protein
MASKVVVPFLVAMMLLTGVCNTLLSKYQASSSVSMLLSTILTDLPLGPSMCSELRLEGPQKICVVLPTSNTNVCTEKPS